MKRNARPWAMGLACLLLATGCGDGKPGAPEQKQVVLFTSLDRIFSESVIEDWSAANGIKVQYQTDTEAVKTVGLVNRIIERKDYPECDVYWNNELGQTMVLKAQGVLEPYVPKNAADIPAKWKDPDGYWTGFAARARVILYNTDLMKAEDAPKTLEDLADPKYKDKVIIAKPLFGTTYTQAAALFSVWGEEKAKAWFRKLKENGVAVAPGNAQARNMVADGERPICLTDTDDANGAFLKSRPVAMIYPDQEGMGTLVIPNSVCLIKNSPNPEGGKKLIEHLVSKELEARMAKSESAQFPLRLDVLPYSERFDPKTIKAMEVDWEGVAKQFPAVKDFVRSEMNW